MDLRLAVPHEATATEAAALLKAILEGIARGYLPRYRRLRESGWLPPLYSSGVAPAIDPDYAGGVERLRLPEQAYRDGWVDCDRAILWRLCDLWLAGEPARVRALAGDAHGDMHVLIRRASGALEDPMERL